jgi:manganese transport protein
MFSNLKKRTQGLYLLGPALVAGVAYLDPGNVATNLTAGAEFGYMLLWVIVLANTTAWLVQYLSAKLGVVTGKSLPTVLGERFKSKPARILYWIQAELIAMATDVAEVVGGALALYIIFDIPLIYGGLITGAISLGMLGLQGTGRVRGFEFVIIGLVAVTSVGFLAGLFVAPPDPGQVAAGLIPQFDGSESLLLAVGIIGATIMPHAIYAHSALSRDRFPDLYQSGSKERVLRATKWDVSLAMLIAGAVNVGILLVGAVTLFGQTETDSILGAHAAISLNLGEGIALLFAVGLLASGLASSSVGAYAGSVIMEGLIKKKVSILVRRSVTLIPALIILSLNVNATQALVLSQVVLSFGIPFALFPLVKLCSDSNLMGKYRSRAWVSCLGYLIAGTLSVLNALLIWLSFGLFSPS